jgi:hypothetical protein
LMSPFPAALHSFLDPAGGKSNAACIESAAAFGAYGAEPGATADETDTSRMDR